MGTTQAKAVVLNVVSSPPVVMVFLGLAWNVAATLDLIQPINEDATGPVNVGPQCAHEHTYQPAAAFSRTQCHDT